MSAASVAVSPPPLLASVRESCAFAWRVTRRFCNRTSVAITLFVYAILRCLSPAFLESKVRELILLGSCLWLHLQICWRKEHSRDQRAEITRLTETIQRLEATLAPLAAARDAGEAARASAEERARVLEASAAVLARRVAALEGEKALLGASLGGRQEEMGAMERALEAALRGQEAARCRVSALEADLVAASARLQKESARRRDAERALAQAKVEPRDEATLLFERHQREAAALRAEINALLERGV